MILEDRRIATEATLAVYTGKAFAWGRFDCARLAYRQMRALGHRPKALQAKLAAFAAAASPLAYVAYGLATSFHETGQRMQPVPEIGRGRNYPYGKPGKHAGQVAYGRGDVQLTWDYNYERADNELGLNGALTSNYDRAMETEISAQIMVLGMTEGWFTGKRFASYLPANGPATRIAFTSARRIINGIDKAEMIAGYAMSFQAALVAGGWA